MGADGHITIWIRDRAIKAFPEADDLFGLLPNCYQHKLMGVELYHAYHGDGMYSDWRDISDWLSEYKGSPSLERQKEFFAWLQENQETGWEVWT